MEPLQLEPSPERVQIRIEHASKDMLLHFERFSSPLSFSPFFCLLGVSLAGTVPLMESKRTQSVLEAYRHLYI